MNSRKKMSAQIGGILLIFLTISSSFYITYANEKDDYLKGKANFELSYQFKLQNTGSLNLTSLNIRLAMLKTWDPVQIVDNLLIRTTPNQTLNDEYNNTFAQYNFENFQVNRSLDLSFDANLTLNLLDYTAYKFKDQPYDVENDQYKLFTQFHQLTDTTDLATLSVANQIVSNNNPVDIAYNAYNFTSTYLKYRLLSTARGSSFALRNGYGDCDEFTDLFLALIRSHGIPGVEHTAWLADFTTGFTTSDEGAAAHAYPMFMIPGYGMFPADPTRGNSDIFGNWLKTDEKRITLTRGPDQPYRSTKYRWIPIPGVNDPIVVSNYTITIHKMEVNYFSKVRSLIFVLIVMIPVLFVLYGIQKGYKLRKYNQMKIRRMLDPKLSNNK